MRLVEVKAVKSAKRIKDLEAQVEHLKSLLGAERTTEESWAEYLPQDQRDQFAARALIQEWGDVQRALVRLGFECERGKRETRELGDRIFTTPGCQEYLNRNLADLESGKQAMLTRLMQIAINGEDKNAVTAASQLSKIMGLNKADQGALPAGATQNIFIQMGSANNDGERHRVETIDTDAVIDASDFLVHEPGEATLVDDSEDPVALHA